MTQAILVSTSVDCGRYAYVRKVAFDLFATAS